MTKKKETAEVPAEPVAPDAWALHYALLEQFTRVLEVRPDIKVYGYGCDRTVELVSLKADGGGGPRRVSSPFGRRNVMTYRELAYALLEACDFVDAANPEWAARREANRQV